MLTRLKVDGFKNLVDVDVSFGPFTCIAGVNGVGKSNLFDAIAFLGALSGKPLMDAALSVRSEGGRTSEDKDGTTYVTLHQDLGSEYKGGGRPRHHIAGKLPRTVLSNVNAAESATAVLARREMQSWQLLQLEPSALRSPDPYTSPRSIATNGAHIPATLARLAKLDLNPARQRDANRSLGGEAAAVYARVANRLSELIEGVRLIRVDVDDRRELLTLLLADRDGTEHEARSLSDGTLRFLALAVLESDSDVRGVLCMEEPENGIHRELAALIAQSSWE